jgi:hypothetical protein
LQIRFTFRSWITNPHQQKDFLNKRSSLNLAQKLFWAEKGLNLWSKNYTLLIISDLNKNPLIIYYRQNPGCPESPDFYYRHNPFSPETGIFYYGQNAECPERGDFYYRVNPFCR